MDDIKYIKRLYQSEGVSIRKIMRRTGYHYETVKKYLDLEDFNEPLHPPQKSTSLLDPLKPIIYQWLLDDLKAPRKQRHTAKRIFERLQTIYLITDLYGHSLSVHFYGNLHKRFVLSIVF